MSYLNEIKAYWNQRSDGYSRQVQDEIETDYDAWKERFARLLADAPGIKALDMGCGPGLFTILLADLGYDMTSVDYSEDMLKEAQKNTASRGLTSRFLQGDAHKLSFDDDSFDVIVSRNLTWNLEHPADAYQEWLRILRPGGLLINFDGNHYSYLYREEYLLERRQEDFFDGHNPEYMKNINVSIIDNIAKELPLSKEMRPQWDMEVLIRLGVSSVGAELLHHSFTDAEGNYHKILKKFILKAVK